MENCIIIGCGPIALGLALALAKKRRELQSTFVESFRQSKSEFDENSNLHDFDSVSFDRRDEKPQSLMLPDYEIHIYESRGEESIGLENQEDSYPIGLNARALKFLQSLSLSLYNDDGEDTDNQQEQGIASFLEDADCGVDIIEKNKKYLSQSLDSADISLEDKEEQNTKASVFEMKDYPVTDERTTNMNVNMKDIKNSNFNMSIRETSIVNKVLSNSLIVDAWEVYAGKKKVARLDSNTVHGTTRGFITQLLYQECLKKENRDIIHIHFNMKLVRLNVEEKSLWFEKKSSSSNNNNKYKDLNRGVNLTQPTTCLVAIDGSRSRVFGCDGVYSKLRTELVAQNLLQAKLTPWTSTHRVLFCKENVFGIHEKNDLLDPGVHYIQNGTYLAIIRAENRASLLYNNSNNHKLVNPCKWTCVIGCFDNADESLKNLLLSKDDTDENVQKLYEYLKTHVPLIAPLLEIKTHNTRNSLNRSCIEMKEENKETIQESPAKKNIEESKDQQQQPCKSIDEDGENKFVESGQVDNGCDYHYNYKELKKYFHRRTFTGSIVSISSLNYAEWICFLGDAAHSVLPATGEGINSGFEDVDILVNTCLENCCSIDPTETLKFPLMSNAIDSSNQDIHQNLNLSRSNFKDDRENFANSIFDDRIDNTTENDQVLDSIRKASNLVPSASFNSLNSYVSNESTTSHSLRITKNLRWFENFNETRFEDIEALGKLALYLNETNNLQSNHPEKISRLVFTIIQSICIRLRIFKYSYEDLTFGTKGRERLPYSYIVGMWTRRQSYLLPLSRGLVYPIWFITYLLFYLPCSVLRAFRERKHLVCKT